THHVRRDSERSRAGVPARFQARSRSHRATRTRLRAQRRAACGRVRGPERLRARARGVPLVALGLAAGAVQEAGAWALAAHLLRRARSRPPANLPGDPGRTRGLAAPSW